MIPGPVISGNVERAMLDGSKRLRNDRNIVEAGGKDAENAGA
jgi:hypothetical protein